MRGDSTLFDDDKGLMRPARTRTQDGESRATFFGTKHATIIFVEQELIDDTLIYKDIDKHFRITPTRTAAATHCSSSSRCPVPYQVRFTPSVPVSKHDNVSRLIINEHANFEQLANLTLKEIDGGARPSTHLVPIPTP